MKYFIVLVVIQTLIANALATVGSDCSSTACVTTVEQCLSDACECAANHINKGDGTCVSNACSSTTCSAIANSYCDTSSVCVCDALSVTSTTAGATKGACVAKTCTGGGTDCNTIANAECSVATGSGTCICSSGYTMTEGVCALPASSAGMVVASLGAMLFTLLLQVSLL